MSDEPGLFEVPPEAYVVPPPAEKLTAGQRRERLVQARIARGEHPLGRIRIHAEAAPGREGDGLRCSGCRFRVTVRGPSGRGWPKCRLPLVIGGRETFPRDTSSETSDIRAWWPACVDYEPREIPVLKSAVISECGRYRYELRRVWDPTGPVLEFIMLNPSKADASIDDPTVRRCIGFAKAWGYGGIVIRNLFGWRATDPAELVNLQDPVGPENRAHLANADADCTIVAWGAHPAAVGWWNGYPFGWQKTAIVRPKLFCLGTNAGGSPKHPLYVPADRTPIRWAPPHPQMSR